MATKITKKRDGSAWRIHVDGQPTSLTITKGLPPRYREPQMYDVCDDHDDYLFETKSVARAMEIVARLASLGR